MSNLATIVNNILADSGIDDINVVVTTGSYANPAWITALSWSKITSTPTTLSGYGITDAVPANRTITINGDTQDLSANRTWTIAAGVTSVSAGTGISVNQTTGAVTVTNTGVLVNDITSSSGQGRFGGWYQGNGYTGPALEVGYSGGAGNVIVYDRSGGGYQPLYITGSNLYLRQSGGLVWTNSQLVRESAGVGWLSGNYASSETSTTTGAIYSIGGSYYPTGSTLNTMYGVGYTHANQGQMISGANSWGFYVTGNGTVRVWLGGDNGNIIASGDIYANTSSIVATQSWVTSQGYITGSYLPLSGGTLSGNLALSGFSNPHITITASSGSYSYLELNDGSSNGYLIKNRSSNTDNGALAGALYLYTDNSKPTQIIHSSSPNATFFSGGDVYIRGQVYVGGNGASTGTQLVYNSGTWGINISGNSATASTATYATSSTRLYASDSPYCYGCAYPYYMYMTYDGTYWRLQVTPASPSAVRVAYADSAGSASTASQVTINYNNDSNSTYQMLWGSGNSVYGTAGVYVNPYTDTIYTAAYRGNANVAGTGEAIYTPAGIYSTGTNWLYGTMYLNVNPIYDTGDIRTYNSSYFFRARYTAGSDIYHGSLNWYGLQLGNNGDNYIIAGRSATGGQLRFYVNNTSDFTSVNGTLSAVMFASGRTTFGNASDYGYMLNVAGSFFATDWIRVNGTSGLYFESYGGGWRMTDSSYIRSYNGKALSMEGASVDFVSSIYMNGGVYIQTNNNRNLLVKSSGAADCGILGRGNGDQFAFQVYGSGGGDYGFLNSAWGAWDIRKTPNGAMYMNDNTSYYLYTNSSSFSALFNGTVRLDSGAFGTNSRSGSSQAVISRTFAPQGASFGWNNGGVTAAIKIRLPFRGNDCMWSMKVRIYNYTNDSTSEYTIGNYSYAAGAYHRGAYYMGGTGSTPQTVRFGNDGSYDCVWIGETSTYWSYPQVSVMDFQGGYVRCTVQETANNWDISFVTSFNTVADSVTPSIRFSNVYAPIYYDIDNTNYYLDPASTSVLNQINFGTAYISGQLRNNGSVGDDDTFGIFWDSSGSTAYAIFRESGAWDYPYPDLRIAFHTGIKIGANASYKGVRFYTDYDMSGLVLSVNNADYNTGGIYVHGTAYASAYYETSDARVKTILEDNTRVKGIESIKPKLYEKDGKTEFGYIAQDFLDIMPYAINNDNVDGYYSLVYREVHTAKIAYLEDSIEEIKAKILYLENQLKTKQ